MHKRFRDGILDLPLLLAACIGCTNPAPGSGAGQGLPPSVPAPLAPDAGSQDGGAPAALAVHLVDGPLDRYKEVKVEVLKVAILDNQGTQKELGSPNKVIDLLKLRDGISETLAQTQIAPGQYAELRLFLGMNNSLRLADDSVHALKVPSGQQSGLKLLLGLEVKADDSRDLVIDFDVAESIHLVGAGKSNQFLLRPLLHVVDQQQSGTISGHLSSSGLPLAGAAVYAETRDAQGQPTIVRRVVSDSDGNYRLDLLPLAATYAVVTQPTVGGITCEAKASPDIALSQEVRAATFDATCTSAAVVGALSVEVTTAATEQQADTCFLMQRASDRLLIVRSDVTTTGAGEQALFDGLPGGDYTAQCWRRSTDASGNPAVSASSSASAMVTGNSTATAQVSF